MAATSNGKAPAGSTSAQQQAAIQPCRYKTGKTLGAGSYSVVKECVHIDTGRYYAAKVINKRLMAGREHMVSSARPWPLSLAVLLSSSPSSSSSSSSAASLLGDFGGCASRPLALRRQLLTPPLLL